MSDTTGSSEELILTDEDLDLLLKYINEDRLEKYKLLEKEEKDIFVDDNKKRNVFRKKKTINGFKEMSKLELIEKLKNGDEDLKDFLEKIIISKLIEKKVILKNKKKLNITYNGENIHVIKLYKNKYYKQNFYKHYLEELGKEDLYELIDESEISEESETTKKLKRFEEDYMNEKRQKNLIYDNSYLFKKNDKKVEIKKEVEDILKGVYNKNTKKDKPIYDDKDFDKEKFEQKFLVSYFLRKKFVKKKKKKKKSQKSNEKKDKQTIFLDQELDRQMYLRRKEIYEKEENNELQEHLKEQTLEWRVNYFFDKIKEWKKLSREDLMKQFDKYTEFDFNDFKLKRDKEDRIRDFILGLNDYRVARKVQRKLFDTYIYKEPILIGNYSPNKNNSSIELNSDIEIKKSINNSQSSNSKEKKI